ncbi:MAG: NAD(P)-binding domain-containing protein [Candidatus Kapaibacteriales bacterium]
MQKVGIIGTGTVGQKLSEGFLAEGYEVRIGTRDTSKVEARENLEGVSVAQAAAFSDLVVLAVKGSVALDAIAGLDLAGKTVIDACNPIADAPPEKGVLKFFTEGGDDSLIGRLQEAHPEARFVKAFSCVGAHLMYKPDFGAEKPTMFICGNSEAAKAEVKGVLDSFGWETADMGGTEAGATIENLCILWCIPGFAENKWNHAFKLLGM